jgi:hypothetical protein
MPQDQGAPITDAANTGTTISPEEMRELVKKIEMSGALGRSRLYIKLLRYLCEASIAGSAPKEIVIAMDVMGKSADFDVKNDSLVRVYIHKLRHKLQGYYTQQGQSDRFCLTIPKGQYLLSAALQHDTVPPVVEEIPQRFSLWSWVLRYQNWALLLFSALLAANLLYQPGRELQGSDNGNPTGASIIGSPVWAPLMDDDDPILLVIGNYFIFGERQFNGKPDRLLREYHVNSPADLEEYRQASDTPSQYYNLDLSYVPRAVAFALKDILPTLSSTGKPITVRMSSDLKGEDLKSQHILYLGYISGMGELESFAFQASSFMIGNSYDELIHLETGEDYTSSELGSVDNSDSFYDYGMISSFPMLDGHQMMFIAGTRDIGIMHMAQLTTNPRYLQTLAESINRSSGPQGATSFEAFYRVIGYDGLNFDAENIYSGELDYKRIWGGEMMDVLD